MGFSSVSRMLMQGAIIVASRSLETTALTFLTCCAMSDEAAVFRDRKRGVAIPAMLKARVAIATTTKCAGGKVHTRQKPVCKRSRSVNARNFASVTPSKHLLKSVGVGTIELKGGFSGMQVIVWWSHLVYI